MLHASNAIIMIHLCIHFHLSNAAHITGSNSNVQSQMKYLLGAAVVVMSE